MWGGGGGGFPVIVTVKSVRFNQVPGVSVQFTGSEQPAKIVGKEGT